MLLYEYIVTITTLSSYCIISIIKFITISWLPTFCSTINYHILRKHQPYTVIHYICIYIYTCICIYIYIHIDIWLLIYIYIYIQWSQLYPALFLFCFIPATPWLWLSRSQQVPATNEVGEIHARQGLVKIAHVLTESSPYGSPDSAENPRDEMMKAMKKPYTQIIHGAGIFTYIYPINDPVL